MGLSKVDSDGNYIIEEGHDKTSHWDNILFCAACTFGIFSAITFWRFLKGVKNGMLYVEHIQYNRKVFMFK